AVVSDEPARLVPSASHLVDADGFERGDELLRGGPSGPVWQKGLVPSRLGARVGKRRFRSRRLTPLRSRRAHADPRLVHGLPSSVRSAGSAFMSVIPEACSAGLGA